MQGVIIMLCLVFKVRAMSRKYFWDRLNRRGSSGTNAREKDPTNKGSKDGKGHHISHNKCKLGENSFGDNGMRMIFPILVFDNY